MKFTTVWATIAAQNVTLKVVVIALSVCSLVFSIATVRLALKAPIIIDRECYSKAVSSASSKHTSSEIESFLKAAIPARFDSNAGEFRPLLSEEELQYRLKEQDDLAKKGVAQHVVVNSIKIESDRTTVDADRLLSVGKIRSALPFPLQIVLSTTDRSAANPYGLVMKKVSAIEVTK